MSDGPGEQEQRPLTPAEQARAALMTALEADEAERSRAFARTMRLRAQLHTAWDGDGQVVMELAGTARIGQQRASTQLLDGVRLRDLFPHALELLDAGHLRQGSVEILLRGTARCTEAVQAEVGRRVLDRLVTLDAADAYRLVEATVPEVESDLELEEQQRRHAQARADRGVWVKPVEDGMALIGATVDQISAHRFALDLDELVRLEGLADARTGRVRTKAQRRADLLSELPTRHLALLHGLRTGRIEQLLADAGHLTSTADAPTASSPTSSPESAAAEPLPLDLPDPVPPRAWDLDPDALLAGLLALPVRGPTVVYVHVPMSTLLEIDHRAGYVEGLGSVPAQLVRLLVPDAGLRRVAVNPRTGLPYGVDPAPHVPIDITRYQHATPPPDPGPGEPGAPGEPGGGPPPDAPPDAPPDPLPGFSAPADPADPMLRSELERERLLTMLGPLTLRQRAEPRHDPSSGLRRFVEIRDLMCTGPGCRRTARACDFDHGDSFAEGGQTAAWNLDAKSRRCHLAKHHGWSAETDLDEGITTWQSPTGRTYTRHHPWQPHAPLSDDLTLPLPHLPELPEATPSWPDAPLLLPPPKAEAEAPAPPRLTWHDDGPPPF